MGTYEKEIQRAIRNSDSIINEVLYIKEGEIDLNKLELVQSPKYQCNFMKQFYRRLELHMAGDKRIIHDTVENVVFIQKPKSGEEL